MDRRRSAFGVFVFAALLLVCGTAFAAKSYPDRVGDVTGGSGPDLTSITLSNTKTKTKITFRIRFARTPPLRVSAREKWVDMLLIGIDVPPLGPRPVKPGDEWTGANFALGTHGPSKTGQVVQLGEGIPTSSRRVAAFKIVTRGATLTFSIPRRVLGSPAWFTFTVAAARESENDAAGGGVDLAPAHGTFRYALT
ncbi:MAG TPA: hypothetical protein VF321_00920 [Gaiellaceae bacterium]